MILAFTPPAFPLGYPPNRRTAPGWRELLLAAAIIFAAPVTLLIPALIAMALK
jgi:hypothetical protein